MNHHFQCTDCGAEYPGGEIIYLCPACSTANRPDTPPRGILRTVYPYDQIRMGSAQDLFEHLISQRFLPLLPLGSMDSWPNLRIGATPLYKATERTSGNAGSSELYLKDDSQNPTFSSKDRASALVSSYAKERGISRLIAASTGNAGSSLAGICAAQGQDAIILVPAAAPPAKLTQVMMYGATLVPVKGTYDDAFDLSVEVSRRYGLYNRNTAFNPLTIEGKKTVSLELYEQLGCKVPDRVFVPTGDGVIYAGVCRGFEDLLNLGLIDRMPVVVAVQSTGSSNLADNLGSENFISHPSDTLADSISVDVPRCFHFTKKLIESYAGAVITVTDTEILEASAKLARTAGIFTEPAAAAAFAGYAKYLAEGRIGDGTVNVALLTGSGLKDLRSVQGLVRMPDPVEPDIREVERVVGLK